MDIQRLIILLNGKKETPTSGYTKINPICANGKHRDSYNLVVYIPKITMGMQ